MPAAARSGKLTLGPPIGGSSPDGDLIDVYRRRRDCQAPCCLAAELRGVRLSREHVVV